METVATGLQRIVFDMDDTLLQTGVLYRRALRRFADRVREQFPQVSDSKEVITRQEIIDQESLAQQGFSKERFPRSLAETWKYYCRGCGEDPRPDDLRVAEEIGRSVYETIPDPLDGMNDLLVDLSRRYDLVLYTMGDPTVQRPKIREHNLAEHFQELHIVPAKDTETLARVVQPYLPEQVLLVGDSLRSEIRPALDLGVPCVYRKPEFPWSYHQVELEESVPVIKRLPELKQLLDRGT